MSTDLSGAAGGVWTLKSPWAGALVPSSGSKSGGGEAECSGGELYPTALGGVPGLDIEEFFPGKLWQGPSARSPEDDALLTPAVADLDLISSSSAHQATGKIWSCDTDPLWSSSREDLVSRGSGGTRPPPGLRLAGPDSAVFGNLGAAQYFRSMYSPSNGKSTSTFKFFFFTSMIIYYYR